MLKAFTLPLTPVMDALLTGGFNMQVHVFKYTCKIWYNLSPELDFLILADNFKKYWKLNKF